MAAVCPAPGPDDPLVRSLLGTVDCNVQLLVRDGYASLFASDGGGLSTLLTVLLTLYVALLGYRLILGRAQLQVGDLALTLIKIGAVLAVATQWGTYQAVVYDLLFRGPQELAGAVLGGVQRQGSLVSGDVFDGLQRAYDVLSAAAEDYGRRAPPQISPVPAGPALGAFSLTAAAGLLLLSSLGVLLVAKMVLGLLLAVGPVFIALVLFDATRGLFEGWLRAALACALAPLSVTLLAAVALTLLEPSIQQLLEARAQGVYPPAPAYGVMILVLVFAGVSLGAVIAGVVVAAGLRLPRGRGERGPAAGAGSDRVRDVAATADQPRATRVAAAASAAERRDARIYGAAGGEGAWAPNSERRAGAPGPAERGVQAATAPSQGTPGQGRLGQSPRRQARPHDARSAR